MARRPGNRPFEALKKLMDDGGLELHPGTDKLVAPPKHIDDALSDDEAFVAGMAGVAPLGWSETPLKLPAAFEIPVWAESEREALDELRGFVEGRGEMDPFATGEGVEGASSSRAERFLPRLKNGDFSVQDHLDLHGLSLDDAKASMELFLRRAQHRRLSCVRIVHGRGKHSPTEPHAMKSAVTRWLTSRKLRRTVVAFASARWRDGGSGAVYVLLASRRS
jgi:DNA-nicking Smr family endonuclease